MKRAAIVVTVLLMLLLTVTSCETTGINTGQLNLVSSAEEVKLGSELSGEIEKQERVLNNPALTGYVNGIGQRLAAQSGRADVSYTFKIIDNDEQINAFALPGGPVYVYTGLLRSADSEAELAGVLGHEIGHVAARHATEQLTKKYGYFLVAQIVLGQDPGATTALARDIVGNLGMLKFSRNDEIEADRLGVRYMYATGYNPNAMITFQQKLGRLHSQNPNRVLNLLSTHPLSQDRITAIKSEMATMPAGKPVDYYADRYKQIVGRELK
jgi:predicted Zn-dependent protease